VFCLSILRLKPLPSAFEERSGIWAVAENDISCFWLPALLSGKTEPDLEQASEKLLPLAAWRTAQGQCAPSFQAFRHTPLPRQERRRPTTPTIKYLRGAAGFGLGTTIKYL
jgi:hypothetical protein